MSLSVMHKSNNSGPGFSHGVWGYCPLAGIKVDPELGRFFHDDFANFQAHATSGSAEQQYGTYLDTGASFVKSADEVDGAIEVSGNDADNDEAHIITGGNAGGMLVVKSVDLAAQRFWFEASVETASIAADGVAFFIGLAEEGMAAADALVDDTGALADKDYIGFRTLHADNDGLDAVYNTAGGGGESIHVESGATTAPAAMTLAAATAVKVGLYYDGSHVHWYVNGEDVDSTGVGVKHDATNLPDGEELCLCLLTKVGTAAAVEVKAHFWAAAQLF